MAFQLDPLTGLPRSGTNTGYSGMPLAFNSTASTGTSSATGVNAGAPAGATPSADQFNNFLANDPYLKQLTADLGAQGIADEASARARAQQGFIRFGEVPGELDPSSASWVDETTRNLASQNTQAGTSVVARLNKQNADAVRQLRNALAARGALRSGELGYRLKENQQAYTNAQYDARTQLLDYLSGIQSGLAAANRTRQGQYAGAVGDAAGRMASQPPPAAPPTTAPPAPPTSGQETGSGYYSDEYRTPGFKKRLLDGTEVSF